MEREPKRKIKLSLCVYALGAKRKHSSKQTFVRIRKTVTGSQEKAKKKKRPKLDTETNPASKRAHIATPSEIGNRIGGE